MNELPAHTVVGDAVEFGRKVTRGALVEIAKAFAYGLLGLFILVTVFPRDWDNTDHRATKTRSEMRLRRDHGTGCQYLESREGALTPRMDRQGRQVCQ